MGTLNEIIQKSQEIEQAMQAGLISAEEMQIEKDKLKAKAKIAISAEVGAL